MHCCREGVRAGAGVDQELPLPQRELSREGICVQQRGREPGQRGCHSSQLDQGTVPLPPLLSAPQLRQRGLERQGSEGRGAQMAGCPSTPTLPAGPELPSCARLRQFIFSLRCKFYIGLNCNK